MRKIIIIFILVARGSQVLQSTKFSGVEQEVIYGSLNSSKEWFDSVPNDYARVKLPPLPCSTSKDCAKWSEPLECRENQCACMPPLCWVYHIENSGWTTNYIFTCGSCGVLGSACNVTTDCHYPGVCGADRYCHCAEGEHVGDICIVTDTTWVYKSAIVGFALIFLLTLCVALYNIYQNCNLHPCCGACSRKEHSTPCEKTPAFTIQSTMNQVLENNNRQERSSATSQQIQITDSNTSTRAMQSPDDNISVISSSDHSSTLSQRESNGSNNVGSHAALGSQHQTIEFPHSSSNTAQRDSNQRVMLSPTIRRLGKNNPPMVNSDTEALIESTYL